MTRPSPKTSDAPGYRKPRFTREERARRKALFLRIFRTTGSRTRACEAAGISWRLAERWAEHDNEFRQNFIAARVEADDRLLTEARRRAVEGNNEGVWYKGELVGFERKYSDGLMQSFLKARFPEFRDRQEVAHTGDVNIRVTFEGEADDDVGELIGGDFRFSA